MSGKEKIIDKIRALFAIADSKRNIDDASPAMVDAYEKEATAALNMAHKLLEKFNLDRSQIIITQTENEPIINLPVMGRTIINYPYKKDSAWWKELAKIIAPSQFCRVGFANQDQISFYGLDIDRELCIFQFEKFAEIAMNLCKIEMKKAKKLAGEEITDIKTGITTNYPAWQGNQIFETAYHFGFRNSLKEVFAGETVFNPTIEKLNRDVEMYFRIQSRMNNERKELYEYYLNSPPTFAYAIEMGEKIGSRIATKSEKKVEEIKSDALARNNSLQEIKFVGEVFILADDSGSMSGNKSQQMRKGAIDYAYQAISKGWKVGLISFGDNGRLLIGPQKEITEEFINAIERLQGCSGFTNMLDPLSIAMYKLNPNIKRAVCICTDGNPTQGKDGQTAKDATLALARDLKAQGIEISCVGTLDADKEFLDQLASSKEMSFLTDDINFGSQIGKAALLLIA